MAEKKIDRVNTITEYHRWANLPKPEHPLISLVDYSQIRHTSETNELRWIQGFYSIGLKRDVVGKYRYGQQQYDFDEGLMTFFSPGQLISVQLEENSIKQPTGWILLVHPDFFFGSSLVKKIRKYEFLNYSVSEALFLSDKEERIIEDILLNIKSEYHSNLDQFSQEIIVNQIELLLNYSERFYQRQFLTRKISNHQLLDRLETLLHGYFNTENVQHEGLPTVQHIAESLNVTPDYLSSMLKSLTGQTTQQHIHNQLIEKAKERLSTTTLSVGEIAYELGFEHPQSFNKLFKSKTDQTPLQFRASFN